jgi:activating signal cointegrator complex subunit 3
MMRFDEKGGFLYITESGRVASHFYIKHGTMELFNEKLERQMTISQILNLISHSSEFENIVPREDEMPELDELAR